MKIANKSHRESVSFKKTELHLIDSRDALCRHYQLGKSDLVKFLIKKEEHTIKNFHSTLIV